MFRKNSAGDPARVLADLLTAKGAGDTPEPGAPVSADPVVQNGGDRLLALSFSSERPVLREYEFGPAWEVLGHDPQEADLSRLNSGAAPLLKDHRRDVDSQIGVVVSAQITGGRGRAVVQFADTPDGNAMLARVRSGEVRNVSVGYAVRKLAPAGDHEGVPVVRATEWEAIEISLVATPADPTVGVGRSLGFTARPSILKGETMKKDHPGGETAVLDERGRAAEISALGRQFNMDPGAVSDAIARGTSVDEFNRSILDAMATGNATATRSRLSAPALAGRERAYSLTRAAAAHLTGDWREAGFEREVGQEMARATGRTPQGFYVPTAVLAGRALVTSTTAPALIGTHSMGDAFIDALRPQVRVLELGATRMSGLIENVSVPRMAAGTAAEWIAEDAAATESTPVFDAVSLTMKQLSANTRISRRQLKQSVPAVDAILSNDLRQQIAVALDRAAITGAGTANEPRGVLNVAGIGIRAMAANGAALTWDAVTAIVSMVEAANVDPTALGFLSNYKVKGRMMATPKVAGTDSMILSPDEAEPMLAGHRARFSGNVPDNLTKGTGTNLSALIFGNWSDLLVGQWGGIDLIVDDVTEAAKGNVKLVAHSEWDIAVRHAESFAAIKDIVAA